MCDEEGTGRRAPLQLHLSNIRRGVEEEDFRLGFDLGLEMDDMVWTKQKKERAIVLFLTTVSFFSVFWFALSFVRDLRLHVCPKTGPPSSRKEQKMRHFDRCRQPPSCSQPLTDTPKEIDDGASNDEEVVIVCIENHLSHIILRSPLNQYGSRLFPTIHFN